MKVDTLREEPLFTVTLTGLTKEQQDRVWKFAQGLNGTLPSKREHSVMKAAKRGGGNGRRKVVNMIPCPVGDEPIKIQGSIQHVRAHARKKEFTPDQVNAALDALKQGRE